MRSRRVTVSAVSMMAAVAVGGAAGLVSMSAGSAHATETGADGLIATDTYPTTTMENADGSGLKTVGGVNGDAVAVVRNLTWSADGSRVVWENLAGGCGIFTSDPDLTHIVPVPGDGGGPACYGSEPAFFGGDQQIVYQGPGSEGGSQVDLSTSQLYRAPVLGSGGPSVFQYLLGSADSGFNDAYPRVSGDLISFTRTARTAGAVPQVWVYNVATGKAALAVDNAQDADISPDGKVLVFTRPGSPDLFTAALDGSDVKQLTTDGATVGHQNPAWSPSQTKVAFSTGKSSSVLDLATGTETALPGSGTEPAWQPVNSSAPSPPTSTPTTPPSTPPTSTPPTSPPPTNPPPPVRVPLVQRVAGTDRFDTGVKTSRLLWPSVTEAGPLHAKAVVLATGASFPDALAGGPLAAAAQGPLLLTAPGSLTPETFQEIKRVLPAGGTVYVLGGTAAVSPAVAARLTAYGYHITRLGGTDRYATSRLIAAEVERLVPAASGQPRIAVLATGGTFADALSAGPLAAIAGAPIVLSDGAALDRQTRTFLSTRSVLPVGGPAYRALGITPRPGTPCGDLAGTDRYATSAAVAHCIELVRAEAGAPAGVFTGVATGATYADALTGGALMAIFGDPLLLTAPGTLSAPAADFLASEKRTVGVVEIFGGPNAVSSGVEHSITGLLGAHTLPPMAAAGNEALRTDITKLALGYATRPNAVRDAAGRVQ